MLKLAGMALIGALSAAAAAQGVIALDDARRAARPTPRAETLTVRETPAPAGVASVAKAADGHYWAEAQVNGARVRFLVDTGASTVALTRADASRLGLKPESLTYDYTVTTAAGPAQAAAVTLASVSVAGARVAQVDALVIDHGLETSLLGMTYLGRLSRFEATRTSLILRP